MRNTRVLGICMIILGLLLIDTGYTETPTRWFRVAAGVFAVLGGIIGAVRKPPAVPPAV